MEKLAVKESVASGEVPKAEWLSFWGVGWGEVREERGIQHTAFRNYGIF